MKIGLYLKRLEAKDPNIASDRIRGDWILKFCPQMEEWKPGVQYDAVIFRTPTPEAVKADCVKIFDLCDPLWETRPQDFANFVKQVDGITVPTEQLKKMVQGVTDKPVRVIGDGHYLPYYENRIINLHQERATTAVWFGYAENASVLAPLIPVVTKNRMMLKIISNRNPFPKAQGVEFVKWSLDTFVQEVSRADMAVLPPARPYKSNNREISALLCGIPVAKTPVDILRLTDPGERRKDLVYSPEVIADHDAKDRAIDYIEWVSILHCRKAEIAAKRAVEYTAICGSYDHDRSDVLVFRDHQANKFKEPVLNAKVYKILPHQFVDAPVRIWMDGNIYPRKPAETLVDELLGDFDIAVFKHPWRSCVYEEYPRARQRIPQTHWKLIDAQIEKYKKEGMPLGFGLAECGVILSRASDVTREFFERWWAEISRFSWRDQISFPYVWWKMKDRIRIRLIPAATRFGEWFKYMDHAQ